MTHEQFEQMVRRLEVEAPKDFRAYRFRVGLLAALGYLYVFTILAILIGLLVLLAYFMMTKKGGGGAGLLKLGAGIGLLAFAVVRSLWVKLEPPTGCELSKDEAPKLFSEVEQIRQTLAAPPIHHVLLTDEFNASMSQRPRLGVLGWMKGYLCLGLPLMDAMTPEQLRGVIAHELGHLSGNHNRFTGWIYRVRQTWEQILARLTQEQRWGSGIFTKFFGWYAPYLSAYSFVLARSHEYEADRCAAQVVGAKVAGDGLIQLTLRGAAVEEKFWPDVFRSARSSDKPPEELFVSLGGFARGPVDASLGEKALVRGLRRKTGYVDTHPALRDRLRGLGHPAADASGDSIRALVEEMAQPIATNAAEYYFGDAADRFRLVHSSTWGFLVQEPWKQRHEELRVAEEELAELAKKAEAGPLSGEEAWNRARLTFNADGGDAALPLLRAAVEISPGHAAANYLLGQTLLENDIGEGVGHLETAIKADPTCAPQALDLIRDFHEREGREAEAETYQRQVLKQQDFLATAGEERQGASASDVFLEHGLSIAEVSRIAGNLKGFARVGRAYLVRKQVKHLPEKPFYLLGIVPYTPWYKLETEAAQRALLSDVVGGLAFEGETYIIIIAGSYKSLGKKMKKVSGSLIYERA